MRGEHMRVKLGLGILIVLMAALPAACGGPSMEGTTWKGDGLVTGNVTFTFMTESECQVGIRSVGATGTYTVDGDQVSVDVLEQKLDFTVDGDTMTGSISGASLTLIRQE